MIILTNNVFTIFENDKLNCLIIHIINFDFNLVNEVSRYPNKETIIWNHFN